MMTRNVHMHKSLNELIKPNEPNQYRIVSYAFTYCFILLFYRCHLFSPQHNSFQFHIDIEIDNLIQLTQLANNIVMFYS